MSCATWWATQGCDHNPLSIVWQRQVADFHRAVQTGTISLGAIRNAQTAMFGARDRLCAIKLSSVRFVA